jgi:hypothetical protein
MVHQTEGDKMKLAVVVVAAAGLSSVQASAAEWTTIGKFGIKGIKPAAHGSTNRLATICIAFDGPAMSIALPGLTC